MLKNWEKSSYYPSTLQNFIPINKSLYFTLLHFQGLELSVRVGKKSGASRFTSSFSQSGPVNVSPID